MARIVRHDGLSGGDDHRREQGILLVNIWAFFVGGCFHIAPGMLICANLGQRESFVTVFGPYAFGTDVTPVFLAPMSGVTDAPFRKQADKFGASATITEMVAGDDLHAGRREALQRFRRPNDDATYVVQLIGRDHDSLRRGAAIARNAGADVIDINMGCPSRRVTGGLSGSALMRDLEHAVSLIEAVVDGAAGTAVTLKMRLGWDRDTMNAPALAQRAQDVGAELITVHGRTRQDFYNGVADWATISEVVNAVSIPVIVNGDIKDAATAKEALQQSGARGAMVGRAAIGLAWLPSAIEQEIKTGLAAEEPSFAEQVESLIEQAHDSVEVYGERVGIRTIRKHLAEAISHWSQGYQQDAHDNWQTLKKRACQSSTLPELKSILLSTLKTKLEVAA